MNIEIDEFIQMNLPERQNFLDMLNDYLGEEFTKKDMENSDSFFLTFLHNETGMEFNYIPGGFFDMGFSKTEELNAKKICNPMPLNMNEMRPVRVTKVNSFLISRIPILNHIANKFLNIKIDDSPFIPAFVSRNNAKDLANRFNCRLPYEKEWEYACRALEKTLFTFGDNLPEEEQLNMWLRWDFSNLEEFNCNQFGLYGLFTGEWCEDAYRLSYKDDAQIQSDSYVIRGGGALFWPWQAEEWVWCLSAMRMPSSDLIDGRCGFRLVYDLNDISS